MVVWVCWVCGAAELTVARLGKIAPSIFSHVRANRVLFRLLRYSLYSLKCTSRVSNLLLSVLLVARFN